jgi:hypothetical protein
MKQVNWYKEENKVTYLFAKMHWNLRNHEMKEGMRKLNQQDTTTVHAISDGNILNLDDIMDNTMVLVVAIK